MLGWVSAVTRDAARRQVTPDNLADMSSASRRCYSTLPGRRGIIGFKEGNPVTAEYLNHQLECPYCLTIRLRIPANARPESEIRCDDCGEYLGTWDELQSDFERQGGQNGVFRLDQGRIRRVEDVPKGFSPDE
jgi:formylmethanofuran dehydrogenase subunit E